MMRLAVVDGMVKSVMADGLMGKRSWQQHGDSTRNYKAKLRFQ